MSAFMLCHWCSVKLPINGRRADCTFPCCGKPECEKARRRRYEAERRVRVRETATKEGDR